MVKLWEDSEVKESAPFLYEQTPCSRVPLEKLTVPQLVKKFLASYGM